eukprot:symbB.v1.2.008379.t1/scaffold525.1/size192214/4
MAEKERWHTALSAQEFASLPSQPSMKVLKVEGVCVVLVTGHGRYHALDARCGHRGGPLEEGDLEDLAEGVSVRCPWHGRRYRVDTGCEVLESGEILATPTQRCHRLRVDNGTLMIALSRRDDRIASDTFATDPPGPPGPRSLSIWFPSKESRELQESQEAKSDFIPDEFLF